MSGEGNRSILNRFLNLVLHGLVPGNLDPSPVALTEDLELRAVVRLITSSLEGEPIPTDGAVMTGVLTNYFTASSTSKVRVYVCNSGNVEGATCRVICRVFSGGVERDLLPSVTPVPLGVGILLDYQILASGGTIAGSCSPPGSVTILPIPFSIGT